MIEDGSLERLRRAFAGDAGGAPASRPSGCPEPERIWDAAQGRTAPEAVAPLVDHLAGCATCAEAWRLATALREAPPRARPAPRRAPLAWAVAGALAAAAVTVLVLRPSGEAPTAIIYRAPEDARLQPLVDRVALDRAAFVLRWSDSGPGARYAVTLAREDLTVVAAASDVAASELRIDAGKLAGVADGTPLVWHVEAVLPDGSRLRSPIARVTVTGR